MADISIILPVYNQADHIAKIVPEYLNALGKIPHPCELILVTNACRDNSREICEHLANQFEQVLSVNTQNSGWGTAVKLGLETAHGEIICYTNSARTNAETLVLALLYAIAYPTVVIKANRKIRDNIRRRLGSLLYNLECRALFDLPVWDINGTPKVFPRSFGKLLQVNRNDDLIDTEFMAICQREAYPILEVPVISAKRHSGKSTTNYLSALKMYWGAYDLWRSMRQQSNV